MDEHIHIAITVGLQKRGVEVIRVQDVGLVATDDIVILEFAHLQGLIVFTMDDDFLALGADKQRNEIPFSGLIYAKQHSLSIGQFINELELVAKGYDPIDVENKVVYLPLK